MLTFIDDTHTYLWNGVEKRSVTRILREEELTQYYNSDPWYMERGRCVHKATHLIDKGILDWASVDDRIAGFLRAYVRFRNENPHIQWEYAEIPLYHSLYDYVGTPDRWHPLTDIKTGEEDEIQLGGYYELLRDNGYEPGREAYTLKLNEDGTYIFKPTKERIRTLSQIFLCANTINQWKGKKNGKHNLNT